MVSKRQLIDWALMTLRESAWAPLGVFAFFLVGKAFGAYRHFPHLDIPTHILGGIAITYFFQSAVANSQKLVGKIPLPIFLLLAFTCTGTATVVWEFVEIAADLTLGTRLNSSLERTLLDMLSGLLGGLILSLFYRHRLSMTFQMSEKAPSIDS